MRVVRVRGEYYEVAVATDISERDSSDTEVMGKISGLRKCGE